MNIYEKQLEETHLKPDDLESTLISSKYDTVITEDTLDTANE